MYNQTDDFQTKLIEAIGNGTHEQFLREYEENISSESHSTFKIPLKFENKSNNEDPEYQKTGDSGFDIRANIELAEGLIASIRLGPLERAIIPTGLFFELPEGFELQIRPRSGLAAKKGVTVLNSPGTVDCVTEDTLISTEDGDITIKEIFADNITNIISFNEETFSLENDKIDDIWLVKNKECLEIELDDTSIIIPLEKEVYTKSGWTKAKDLIEGDEILFKDG